MSISIEAANFYVFSFGDIESIIATANGLAAEIVGEGQVLSIVIYADNVMITADGTDLEIKDGVQGTIANGEKMDEGSITYLVLIQYVVPTPIPKPPPTPAKTQSVATVIEVVNNVSSVLAPTNLRAVTKVPTNSYLLFWDESTDDSSVTYYEIYKNNILVGTTTSTTYVFKDLTYSTEYSFKVRVLDTDGKYSDYSSNLVLNTYSRDLELMLAEQSTIGVGGYTCDDYPSFDILVASSNKFLYFGYEDKVEIEVHITGLNLNDENFDINDIKLAYGDGVSISAIESVSYNNYKITLDGNLENLDSYSEDTLQAYFILPSYMFDNGKEHIIIKDFKNIDSLEIPAHILDYDDNFYNDNNNVSLMDYSDYSTAYLEYQLKVEDTLGNVIQDWSIYDGETINIEEGYILIFRNYHILAKKYSDELVFTITEFDIKQNIVNMTVENKIVFGQEDGVIVTVTALNDTFVEDNVTLENFGFWPYLYKTETNETYLLRSVVEITNVEYLDLQTIEVTLSGNAENLDFVKDISYSYQIIIRSPVFANYRFSELDKIYKSPYDKPLAVLTTISEDFVSLDLEEIPNEARALYMVEDSLGNELIGWEEIPEDKIISATNTNIVKLKYSENDIFDESEITILHVIFIADEIDTVSVGYTCYDEFGQILLDSSGFPIETIQGTVNLETGITWNEAVDNGSLDM
jgi:hypothetical protein